MKPLTKVAGLVAAVVIVGYFAWGQFGRDTARPESGNPSSAATGNGKSTLPQTSRDGSASEMKPGQVANVQRLPGSSWANWSTRDNLKALYDEKRNTVASDPEAAFYLHGILRNCVFLTHDGNAKSRERNLRGKYSPDIEAARQAMFERLWSKCAGFEQMAMATVEGELKEFAAIGEKNGNSQFAAREIARSSRSNDPNFGAKVISLLETGDATVLWELAPLALNNQVLKKLGGDSLGASQNALMQAWQMAACDAGYDCQNILVPSFCISAGACTATDYAEGVRMTALSPTEYEIANQLRFKIGNAIRSKNWSSLGLRPPT
ncbi:MAG: hypothetical protein ABL931_03530 [Usitatibacteraceae bacterium]